MKFEHQTIILRDTDKQYFTLKPRRENGQDFSCRAIVTDIRGKFYTFLKRPYKKRKRFYVCFEGSSLFIIKDELNNIVYFYDKFSAESLDNFQIIFDSCKDFEDICESINDLDVLAMYKRGYKGTGKFQKIKIHYKKLQKRTNANFLYIGQLLLSINEFIEAVERTASANKSGYDSIEIDSQEHILNLREAVNNNFLQVMSNQVHELERLGQEFLQTESWSEWKEALEDWRDFFIRMTSEGPKETENIYLNEFKRLFKLRKISQFDYKMLDKKGTFLSNTISRLICEVSKIYGVESYSVINSFKRFYKVKSKNQVFESLINDLAEN